jgi:hypothetical protein
LPLAEPLIIGLWLLGVLIWPQWLSKRRRDLHRDALATCGVQVLSLAALTALIIVSQL